jgi:lantibiotic modifying enzyme
MLAYEVAPALALEAATTIGWGIARRAFWHEDRCTWFDAVPTLPGHNPMHSAALGAEPYGGTAGIGLFLAQLVARADEPTLRRTARGALAHALSRAAELAAHAPLGFYGGAAGSAAVVVLAARALGDDTTARRARDVLLGLTLEPPEPDRTDLVGGIAGTLLALAAAARALDGDAALLARAGDAAARTLALGTRAGATLSWNTMRDKMADLCGFAHGAAGIAHALLALHALAPAPALADAALAAFAYEDARFDPGYDNWPDYRIMPGQPRAPQPSYTAAWCHGAPGIARSRLFAESLGLATGASADAALRATAAQAAAWARSPNPDLTLCHGVFGLADALLDGARSGRVACAPLVARIVGDALERYWRAELPWPSGLQTREEIDGLMMGNAGIGHLLLRVADPSLPSVLAPF